MHSAFPKARDGTKNADDEGEGDTHFVEIL